MHVKCSTCLESLSPSQELNSAPCGHVFHYLCLIQWLDTGKKTCPQCRAPCRENQLRRIYFSESDDIGKGDPNELQDKIDSLTFSNRILEKEKSNLKAEIDKQKAQLVGLKEEFRESERGKNDLNAKIVDYKTQLRYFQSEKSKASAYKKELEEAKSSLQLYKNVQTMIKGSVTEVNLKLHEIGDFSRSSRELSILISALKQELEAGRAEAKKIKSELRTKILKVQELSKTVGVQNKELAELKSVNASIAADLKHSEDDKRTLKSKVEILQGALDSPSGDPRASAINRMVLENPAPLVETEFEAFDSPFHLKTKACSIVGLKENISGRASKRPSSAVPKKRTKGDYINGLLLSSEDADDGRIRSQPITKSFNKFDGKFYNGFGGHDKADLFPAKKKDAFKAINQTGPASKKAPKGVSRPTQKMTKSNFKHIDKYFTLDTP